MQALQSFIEQIDGFISGYILVVLLLGTGIYYTIRLGFLQVSKFIPAMKLTFGGMFKKKDKEEGSLSSFQALATAIAAQVGTGNVGGVATAITLGGPGAIFWMWVTAFLGMSTIFAEAVLAQIFRERRNGELVGGPAFYLSKGMGKKSPMLAKILAGSFAVLIVIALGIIGNMVQSNSIADAVNNSFGIPKLAVGLFIAAVAGLIFIGGVQRIGRFAELVVPAMAVLYILGSIVLLFKYGSELGGALKLIFTSAFTPMAAAGGFAGAMVKQAVKMGVQRGLFSNEAGMGSTPHAHAVANVKHPAQQGLSALVGVFIDTIIVCSATALAIIVTKSYEVEGLQGVRVTQNAFIEAFGPAGGGFLAVCLTFFAFTTIVGWYYFGESNIRYLFGKKGLMPYRILVLAGIVFGSLQEVGVVWALSGFFNSLMVIPNVIGLLVLSPLVIRTLQDYNNQLAKGGELTYHYQDN
ncbi:MAG: sodium:alanine symporter family protein [Tissierellia bacterium]|nr:sodium:alanine symporter family protein [Tissierellia bacterium]